MTQPDAGAPGAGHPADPCSRVTVTAADGATVMACAHGGHLLGWTPGGAAADRLWLSPAARCGPGLAIRGGVPVIFPQFAGRGPLPKHGFARDRAWRLTPGPDGESTAGVVAVLTDDDATRAVWPHPFRLELRTRAAGRELEQRLVVTNPGEAPFTFTAALHGYLAVGDGDRTTLRGLEGRAAENNAADGAGLELPGEPLAVTEPRDVAVPGVDAALVLEDPVLGALVIAAEGFADRVVWNPGPGHGLADVPDGAERGFVCVEPAILTPVTLAPGQEWAGVQRLTAR